MPGRVTLDALNAASSSNFVAALGDVFEYSPWVAAVAATRRPFVGLADLRGAMVQVIDMASPEQRLKLIRNHPDLANKTQRAAGLTSHSSSEQDGAGLDRLSEMEFELFERLNNAYKDKFGFPFILCVRRHDRAIAPWRGPGSSRGDNQCGWPNRRGAGRGPTGADRHLRIAIPRRRLFREPARQPDHAAISRRGPAPLRRIGARAAPARPVAADAVELHDVPR